VTQKRCRWSEHSFDDYVRYHDEEWGLPVHDDQELFEFLILEGAQAGLSWATILKRRSGYRRAFANFDVKEVSKFDEEKIQELLQDPGIIRNKLKVNGAVNNAKRFLEIQAEFGSFDKYIWSFVGGVPIKNSWRLPAETPVTTKESDAISKDLKKRGFKFVGSTIMYAYMQACGLVNDHTTDCFRYKEV
jgi:DNA-3-methyladenine glycosylase I